MRKKAKSSNPQTETRVPARDPFDAIPVLADNAEAKADHESRLQIRMRARPGKSIASRLACRLGFHRDIRVDLDRHGSRYWSLIDGRRSLRDIERHLREEFSLPPDDSKRATLQFTKMLMLRHLVFLDLGSAGEHPEPAPREETPYAP